MAIIYCYTNTINQKKYIGQTINPEQRHFAHKSSAFNENSQDYNSLFHRAVRKYGWEVFQYEVLYETNDLELLNEMEIFFIDYYQTKAPDGYNVLEGGKNALKPMAESTKEKLALIKGELTEDEVIELREAYARRESPKQIYDAKYAERLHYQAFLNIWSGRRYRQIKPDLIEKGRHTKLTAEIVAKIKQDYVTGDYTYSQLAQKYNISKSTISDVIRGKTWKHVQI